MFQTLVEIQRTIYTARADQIKLLSAEGVWLAFLPIGIFFGAVHALTPGHSKAVLATYRWDRTQGWQRRPCAIAANISRGLLGLIGLWMLWRKLSHGHHQKHEGEAVGVMAGLIACPLTLFVMTFAIGRGVPAAGVLFAGTMMIGVALTLSVVILSILLRRRQVRFVEARPRLLEAITRSIERLARAAIVDLAVRELLLR